MRWWKTNRPVVLFLTLGLLGGIGIYRVEGEIRTRCADSRESRQGLRALAQDLATPISVALGADPTLRAQVEDRNRHFMAQRDEFLRQYPPLGC